MQNDFLLKPSDSTSGMGISKVNFKEKIYIIKEKISNAFNNSKSRTILIEEFIAGTNHGFSTFIKDGKIVFHFIDNEHYYINKYMVSGASSPSDISSVTVALLYKEIEKIISLLNLKDGILHVQFILKNQTPYILEICRITPGDLYIKLVKYATGINYPAYIVKAFTGMDISAINNDNNDSRLITRHCIMSKSQGKVNDIIFHDDIKKNIIDQIMFWSKNEQVVDFLNKKFGVNSGERF